MRTLIVLGMALCCVALTLKESDAATTITEKVGSTTPDSIESIPELEKRLKKLVNSGFKMVMPFVLELITEAPIKPNCLRGLFLLVRDLKDMQDWAVKMVDAMGKPASGILEGTSIAFGDYDECLDIVSLRKMQPPPVPPYTEEQIVFRGQYCVVQIKTPESIKQAAMDYQVGNRSASYLANTKSFLRNFVKVAPLANVVEFRLGVCIPSICDASDLDILTNTLSSKVKIQTSVIRCETKQKTEYRMEHVIILCGIGVLAALIFLGTLMDFIIHYNNPDPGDDSVVEMKGFLVQSAVAFSISRNASKLFSLKPSDCPKTSSIRGLKFFSILLYIVVWTYATPLDFHFMKFRSAFNFFQFMKDGWFSVFANGSVGADTLLLIAGLQISYRIWKKNIDTDSIVFIPKFILKWYTRFTLSQGVVICLLICLSLMGNGPLWGDIVTPTIENCQKRWWTNVLAINNFWSAEDTCLPHTWLLCCLFHLLLMGAVLLFILSKSVSFGILVSVALILGSSIAIAIVTLMNDLPPSPAYYFLSFVNIKYIWNNLFIQAYDHTGAFCIGILLGYFLSRHDDVKLKKTTVAIGWCSAVTCNLALLCCLYRYNNGDFMDRTLSAVYAAVHRVGWSLGITWIIVACAYGYGGFVNKILSWKILIICDRLANAVYLVHPLVFFLHDGQLRVNVQMGHLDQVMYATASIVCTMVVATVCYVTCFAPFLFFEKQFWYNDAPSKKNIAKISETPKNKLKYNSNNVKAERGNFQTCLSTATYKQKISTLFNT